MADVSPELAAAIAELRFADAARLIDQLPGERREAALHAVRSAREAAAEEAEHFANRIQLLARDDHYAALYALTTDELTSRRLALLPDRIRRGAEIHLNGAKRRREQSLRSARRQIERCRVALDAFHTGNARLALSRIEETWLEDDDREELTRLRERFEKVKAEADELSALGDRVLAEHQPARRRGSGCLPAALLLLAAAIIAGGL